ncbi:MAG: DUF1538 domain-containing protein [Candidatus Thiodiazotropha sp.]
MNESLQHFIDVLLGTMLDVLPIAAILLGFQVFVLRRALKNPKEILTGFFMVLIGLALFLEGLDLALFPIGELMANQLTAPEFLDAQDAHSIEWHHYFWVYLFAASIGFSTTIAEPSLIAPRSIIALAYDSGGVTTSTVTVPLVTALGLGLSSNVPGRNPLMDGFGLIAFASLFPIITVMGYAQLSEWRSRRPPR